MKRSIIAIITFYVIAISCRMASHLYLETLDGTAVSILFMHLLRLIGGLGPFVGAMFCLLVLGRKTDYSIQGSSWRKSIISWAFPIVLYGLYDIIYSPDISTTLSMTVLLVYGMLEETGWRGYLQSELEKMGIKDWAVPLIIAPMWWIWHLNFSSSAAHIAIHFSAIIAGSYGIGYIIKTTRSVMLASCIHILFNFFLREVYIEKNVVTITIMVASIVFWVWLWYINKTSEKALSTKKQRTV